MMAKQVIINADDFGLSEAVNYGVIDAYRKGVVSSTTLMVNQKAARHAISLLTQAPNLYVGLHVNLTTGYPVSKPETIPSLVKNDGSFVGSKHFKTHEQLFDYHDAYTETKAQVLKFQELFGYLPTHIEPHSATDNYSAKALIDVAGEFGIHVGVPFKGNYFQGSSDVYKQLEYPTDLTSKYGEIIDCGVSVQDFISDEFRILHNHENGKVTELHFHPGYLDQYVLDHSTLTLPRVRDLATLTSPKLMNWFKSNNLELISFGDLKLGD